MDDRFTISEEDYLVIEDALCSNARGRAFLRMRDQNARAVATDEIKRLMRGLSATIRRATPLPEEQGNSTHIRILRQELQEMSVYIQQTRSEIAALRPDDTGNNRIMAATGELDAIVTATERATSDILNAAERIQEIAARLPQSADTKALCQEIEAQTIEILTACSFQDITGQRTTKVVNTLRYLEKRVNSMIEIWGIDNVSAVVDSELADKRPDAHLLNGPSSEGVSQADVDALLAELNAIGPAREQPVAPPERVVPSATGPAAPNPMPVAAVAAAPSPPAAPQKPAAPNGSASVNQSDIDALFD